MCEWLLSDILGLFLTQETWTLITEAVLPHRTIGCSVCVCVCDGGLAILSWLNEVSNNMPEAMLETGHTHRASDAGLKIVAI